MRRRRFRSALGSAIALTLCAGVLGTAADDRESAAGVAEAPALAPFRDEIAGTTLAIEMVPVIPKDGSKPFYMAKTETTWDLYDVFVFGFDQPEAHSEEISQERAASEADAVTRPTKPYILTDRGYGHAGYPAISMSYLGARQFAEWLSKKTGRRYRLPTVAEWRAACDLAGLEGESIEASAWHAGNSEESTHPVGSRKADTLGLFDLRGNVGEWCVNEEGRGVVLGGSFRDGKDALGCTALLNYTPDWNASDPQFPKSKWWLADADFVGFRVICDP